MGILNKVDSWEIHSNLWETAVSCLKDEDKDCIDSIFLTKLDDLLKVVEERKEKTMAD